MPYSITGSLWQIDFTISYSCRVRWAYVFRRGTEDVHKKHGAGRPQSPSDNVHVNAVTALLEEHHL